VNLAEEARLACQRTGHRQAGKEWQSGRPMFFEDGVDQAGKSLDRIESRFGSIRLPVPRSALCSHGDISEPCSAKLGATSDNMIVR
jgi:hypothetical protein